MESNGNDFIGGKNNSNGSLTGDSGKGMSINAYNFLEHPQIISTADGRIELTYDALGNKLQKRVYDEGFVPDPPNNSKGSLDKPTRLLLPFALSRLSHIASNKN